MTTTEHNELNCWIAENVFGFSERIEVAKGRSLKTATNWKTAFKKSPNICSLGDYSRHFSRDGTMFYCGNPSQIHFPSNYTTDPAEAMEVLKKCGEQDMGGVRLKQRRDKTWIVCKDEDLDPLWATAETLELAICLFAKKLFKKP